MVILMSIHIDIFKFIRDMNIGDNFFFPNLEIYEKLIHSFLFSWKNIYNNNRI